LTIAVYPGSFDPVTNGHLDIATRAASLFDQLIIAVYETPPKDLLFTTEERVALLKEAVSHLPRVKVESFSGLIVDFARRVGAKAIVRGLRMSSDFEREIKERRELEWRIKLLKTASIAVPVNLNAPITP